MLGRNKDEKQKDLEENFHMRLNKELKKKIEAKAASEGMSLSEAVRSSLNDYLHKDVNINNEILGHLTSLETEIEQLTRRQELHSNVFIYFLRFFFAFSGKEIEQVPKEMRKQFFDKGEKRRDDFIKLFKSQVSNHTNIFEMMLGDLITEPDNGKEKDDGLGIGD